MVFMRIGLLLWGVSSMVTASTMPTGCQPITVKGETLIINTKKPELVFMQNITDGDLWITHPVNEPSASAGWTSQLNSGNWSALMVTDKSFAINCIESHPGHEQHTACESVIHACTWKKMQVPSQESGTFWAGENRKLQDLKAGLTERGFTLQ